MRHLSVHVYLRSAHVFLSFFSQELQFHNSGFDAIDDAVTAIVGMSWDPKDVWNVGLSDPEGGDLLWFWCWSDCLFQVNLWWCKMPPLIGDKMMMTVLFFLVPFFSTNSSSGWLLKHLMKPPQTCPTTVLCRVSTSSGLRFAGTRGNMPEAWSSRQKRREQLWKGGGFKYCWFSPLFGEDCHFGRAYLSYFQLGLFTHQLEMAQLCWLLTWLIWFVRDTGNNYQVIQVVTFWFPISKKVTTHPWSTPQAIPLLSYERIPFTACW